MHRAYGLVLAVILALPVSANQAFAQSMKELVGTWTAVSNETTRPDGQKVQPFGSKPGVGMLIFDPEGRYSVQICSPDRPKFASNNSGARNSRRVQSCGSWLQSTLGPLFS